MKQLLNKFIADESGATMVEYAILVALIAVASIVIIYAVGQKVSDAFQQVADKLDNPSGTTPTPAP